MPEFHFFSNCWCYLLNSGPQINIDTRTETKVFCFDYKTKFDYNQYCLVGFPRAQMVKNLPAMQEIWVQSLGQEDPCKEGHGNPLQYSCLENSMDSGA